MKATAHLGLFAGLIAVTIAPRIVWPSYYTREQQAVAGKASAQRANEIEAGWKRLEYADLHLPETEAALLKKLDSATGGLSDAQKLELTPRLVQLIHYFEEPSFERYYRLKTEGLDYYFVATGDSNNLHAAVDRPTTQTSTADPKEQSRNLWNSVHQYKGERRLPKITSVALNTVEASISHTNSGRVLLGGPVKNGFTVGREALNPGFHYRGAPWLPNEPVLFEFSFLAEANNSGNVGPMYVSLIWIDKDHKWALNRLVVDTWLGFDTVF